MRLFSSPVNRFFNWLGDVYGRYPSDDVEYPSMLAPSDLQDTSAEGAKVISLRSNHSHAGGRRAA